MQIRRNRPDDYHYIHSLGDHSIRIVETDWNQSLLLTPERGAQAWPVASFDELGPEALTPILEYAPDVLLLATGRRLQIPDWTLQRELLARSIGLEAMSLDAAARTYNILAGENRRVMAAMIWEPGP